MPDDGHRRRRRQWGTERTHAPLPAVHEIPSTAKLIWARIAIWVTVAVWVLYVLTVVVSLILAGAFGLPGRRLTLEQAAASEPVTIETDSIRAL